MKINCISKQKDTENNEILFVNSVYDIVDFIKPKDIIKRFHNYSPTKNSLKLKRYNKN